MPNELLLEILLEQIFAKEIDPLGTVSITRQDGHIVEWHPHGDELAVDLLAELRLSV